MKRHLGWLSVLGVLVWLAGCGGGEKESKRKTLEAKFTKTPIVVDGKLDDAAWKEAKTFRMYLPRDKKAEGRKLFEPGEVKVAWDDSFLYIAVKFSDSDIVAEGEEDQLHHYRMGDLVEVFLKPEDQTWYWELYATPRGKKTSFWFPGRGRLGLESCYKYECGLKVAALCYGTLNNWEDKDTEWTAEMAISVKDLTARGEKFGPESKWRILVARYNYSRHLPWVENSACTPLSKTNFHLYEEYASLRFKK